MANLVPSGPSNCQRASDGIRLVSLERRIFLIPTDSAWIGVRDSALLPLLPVTLSIPVKPALRPVDVPLKPRTLELTNATVVITRADGGIHRFGCRSRLARGPRPRLRRHYGVRSTDARNEPSMSNGVLVVPSSW